MSNHPQSGSAIADVVTPGAITPEAITLGVITVGSINIDLVVKTSRRPQAGETFSGEHFALYVGGKGTNQAVQAALSGARSFMVARLGDDVFAPLVRDLFDRCGVDRNFVVGDPAGSGIGHVVIDSAGDYSTVIVAQANAHLCAEDVDAAHAAFAASQMLLLQLETPIETSLHAARKAKTMGLQVCLNAAPALAIPPALLECVDLLVVNELEAAMLLGQTQPIQTVVEAEAAARRLSAGLRSVVITLGSQGVVAVERTGLVHHLAGHVVKVANTIGAGDAFVGELAVRLAEQMPFAQALRYANAAGALAVTRPEPQGCTPEREKIAALLGQ